MKKTNASQVKPLGENVLIQPEKQAEKTEAGIYLPETASAERSQIGKVIAVGDSDKIQVKAGQKVVFKRYGGEDVKIGDVEYIVANYKDVILVIQ